MTYRGYIKNGVAVLDTPADLPDGTPVRIEVERLDSDFRQNKSVSELSCERCVQPVQSVDELAGDWPGEDSLDDFLALIREVRRQ